MVSGVGAILDALRLGAGMTWEVLWALILGFALSGVVQAVVSKAEMTRLLPDDSRRSLTRATLLGAASSSCSYAAVALARSIFRKGADFTSAMAFQFASTNLVIELGIILAVLMGWEFTAAEFFGGIVMIVLLALLFRATLAPKMIEMARRQAERGIAGRMEGHATMDMSVTRAAVLRNGGISFGGVAAFIFADLIVLPILNIYRKYYGRRMATYLLVTFYLTMAAAGYVVEIVFGLLGLIPEERNANVTEAS